MELGLAVAQHPNTCAQGVLPLGALCWRLKLLTQTTDQLVA
jgi:hypothetical protein